MRPTTADDNVFDFNALLHPGHGVRASARTWCVMSV